MFRFSSICCCLPLLTLVFFHTVRGENPPTIASQPSTPEIAVAEEIQRLAASDFTSRRAAFLKLWKAGDAALPLLSTAKSSPVRPLAEAARVLEILIGLRIDPAMRDESARLLELIGRPSVSATEELCELKYWSVAERILSENVELLQKFQEPYGRYLLSRIVESAVEQDDPAAAWPIVRLVTPLPQRAWISHKTGLSLAPAAADDPSSQSWQFFFAGDIDAALAVQGIPIDLRLMLVTRSGRWSQLVEPQLLTYLTGRQASPVAEAVRATVYEYAGELETSQTMWDRLLASANAAHTADSEDTTARDTAAGESQSPRDVQTAAGLRLLEEVDAGGLGVETSKNQLLAALLFSGRVEPIEQHLMQRDPASAFGFFLAGNNHSAAFESLGLSADLSNFEPWLNARRDAIQGDLNTRAPNTRRFDEAARLCATLSGLGFEAEADRLLTILVELARQAQRQQDDLWARSILGWLGRSEAHALALRAAREEFPRMSVDCQAAVLKGLFPQFADAAYSLWKTAPGDQEAEKWSAMENLYVFDRSFLGNARAGAAELSNWLHRALEHLETEQLSGGHLQALADIALGYGERELALELLMTGAGSGGDPTSNNAQWIEAARILTNSGDAKNALPLFEQVRRAGNHSQQAQFAERQALLLSGEYERAAHIELARWLRPLATTRFYQGYNYLQATREFVEEHRYQAAAEYAEAAFLLADSGSMDSYWGASEYASILEELDQRQRQADVLRAAVVEALQPGFTAANPTMKYMIDNSYFSSLRFAAQKERLSRVVACILEEDWAGVRHHWSVGYRLQPQDIEMVVQSYPRLIERGQAELAGEIFAAYEQSMRAQLAAWPRDATALNNLAWMYACCDRELEQAEELSRRAVELAPSSAIFLDTLAEVQYRSGQVKAAMETMRACVRLDPRETHYRENLVRFRDGK